MSKTPTKGSGQGQSHDDALKEEVVFLQRKVKYIQGVSTVFRQKIAMIIRECAKQPQLFGQDLQKLYASAVGELVQAEADTGAEVAFSPIRKHPRTDQAKEDAKKAHQLCIVLQEKNVIKEREMELRRSFEQLEAKYRDLDSRHTKLVELQSSGGAGWGSAVSVAAQKELSDKRVEELERQLMDAKTEIIQLRTRDGSSVAASAADVALNEASAAKQNVMLRSRVQKLKDEQALLKQQTAEATSQMQSNLDSLLAQLQTQRKEITSREETIKRLFKEKGDIVKELVQSRSMEDTLREQVQRVGVEMTEVRQLQEAQSHAKRDSHDEMTTTVDAYAKKIEELESVVSDLQTKLGDERRVSLEKDLQIQALGSQMAAFRTRLEAHESHAEQQQVQAAMVHEVQQRLLSAVDDIHKTQSTSGLSQQIKDLNEKIHGLEGVEMQLRQKEDQLAVSEDAAAQLQQTVTELRESLLSISTLFLALPKSVDQLERIVIELDAYKEEVARAVESHQPPNVVRLEGIVDLRCLQSATQRRDQQKSKDNRAQIAAAATNKMQSHPQQNIIAALAAASDSDDDDDMELARALDLPPPPTLVDITSTLLGDSSATMGGGGAESILTHTALGINATPARPTTSSATMDAGVVSPAVVTVSESDARLTFQLFDESGSGSLSTDMIQLCLSTLGLPSTRCPPGTRHMSIEEFVAVCVGTR